MKIVELVLNESLEAGIDAVALVEEPAIEQDFYAFNAQKYYFETYNDYPQAAKDAAAMGIKRNEALGNPCATQVGKVRAQQLVNGEKLSLDTIRRMRSFLIRQKDNYDLAKQRRDYDACGYISYLLWGGEAALPWAEKKLRQAGEEFKETFLILDTFAERGPRGGIKASPKAPKSDTPNPSPKGEGSAKGKADSSRGAEVDKATEESLQKKADEFNEKYKDKLGYGANVGALKSVYQRGLGAYNTSHSPNVSSAKQWAMARVNAFLYLIKNGRPQNPKYTTDYDLLPTKHPKREQLSAITEHMIFNALLEHYMDIEVGTLPNYVNEPTEQRKLIGALMEPNKLIRRIDEETNEEYFVYFTEETIAQLAEKFMKDGKIHSTNIEHNDIPLDDVSLIETWIVENPEHDKTNLYNQQYTKGTWVGMYKIDNDEVWKKVKAKEIKGFSIQGLFAELLKSY